MISYTIILILGLAVVIYFLYKEMNKIKSFVHDVHEKIASTINVMETFKSNFKPQTNKLETISEQVFENAQTLNIVSNETLNIVSNEKADIAPTVVEMINDMIVNDNIYCHLSTIKPINQTHTIVIDVIDNNDDEIKNIDSSEIYKLTISETDDSEKSKHVAIYSNDNDDISCDFQLSEILKIGTLDASSDKKINQTTDDYNDAAIDAFARQLDSEECKKIVEELKEDSPFCEQIMFFPSDKKNINNGISDNVIQDINNNVIDNVNNNVIDNVNNNVNNNVIDNVNNNFVQDVNNNVIDTVNKVQDNKEEFIKFQHIQLEKMKLVDLKNMAISKGIQVTKKQNGQTRQKNKNELVEDIIKMI